MNIGEIYRHAYSPQYTCKIIGITHRGAKVKQTEKRQGRKDLVITAFYDAIEFCPQRGFWTPVTPEIDLGIPPVKIVFTPAHRPETNKYQLTLI
jgi:hypothetical protein